MDNCDERKNAATREQNESAGEAHGASGQEFSLDQRGRVAEDTEVDDPDSRWLQGRVGSFDPFDVPGYGSTKAAARPQDSNDQQTAKDTGIEVKNKRLVQQGFYPNRNSFIPIVPKTFSKNIEDEGAKLPGAVIMAPGPKKGKGTGKKRGKYKDKKRISWTSMDLSLAKMPSMTSTMRTTDGALPPFREAEINVSYPDPISNMTDEQLQKWATKSVEPDDRPPDRAEEDAQQNYEDDKEVAFRHVIQRDAAVLVLGLHASGNDISCSVPGFCSCFST